MIKKVVLCCAAASVLSLLAFGRDVVSYARTGAHSLRAAVKREVPVEFELERARTMVESLMPDIRKCMHVIAEQQVDVEHLTQQISQKQVGLDQQKTAILTLRSDLGTGKTTFTYASQKFNLGEVQRDLTIRFERYQAAEESLGADRKILNARQQTLAANREKLENMLQAKKQLELKLEQLDARLRTMQAAEAVSQLAFDDSQLGHARKLVDELNKQLDVKQRLLDTEGKFAGLIPVESPTNVISTTGIEQRVDAYFEQGTAAPAAPEVAHR